MSPGAAGPESHPKEASMNTIPDSFCPGCPYRAPLAAMNRLWLRAVSGGSCSALAAARPFLAVEIAAGHGRAIAALAEAIASAPGKRRELIALCGSDELDAGGLGALATCRGVALAVGDGDIAELCRHSSVELRECPAFDLGAISAALRSALEGEGAAVVFCRGECARTAPRPARAYAIDRDYCRRCGACSRLGCPAISGLRPPQIDPGLCAGCGVCAQVCKCSAIREA